MSKVIVLYVNRYDFKDKSDKQVKGAKISYVDNQINPARPDDQKGKPIIEMGIPFESFSDFKTVPGIYDIEVANIPVSGGNLRVAYLSSKFIKEYKISLD